MQLTVDALNSMIEAHKMNKYYTIDDRRIQVLKNVSLKIAGGEFAVIQGSSGSGKSTLARAVLKLVPQTAGTVAWMGRDISNADRKEMNALRDDLLGGVQLTRRVVRCTKVDDLWSMHTIRFHELVKLMLIACCPIYCCTHLFCIDLIHCKSDPAHKY